MESRYLNFIEIGRSQTGKTAKIQVSNKNGGILGEVSWYGNWRKYCFITDKNVVLDETCMKDISNYIVEKTLEHKESMQEKANRIFAGQHE